MNLHTPEQEVWVKIPYLLAPGANAQWAGSLILEMRDVPDHVQYRQWLNTLPVTECRKKRKRLKTLTGE